MSVLIEAISVVIRLEVIERLYPGGLEGLKECPPNSTLCNDDQLARVGFMAPFDVGNYIGRLEKMGFQFLLDGSARDLAVVDQRQGLTTPCDWLEVIYFDIDDDLNQRVVAAHLAGEDPDPMAAPTGWTLEQSISLGEGYVPNNEFSKRLKFLRREHSLCVYFDNKTGKEVYIGRTSGH